MGLLWSTRHACSCHEEVYRILTLGVFALLMQPIHATSMPIYPIKKQILVHELLVFRSAVCLCSIWIEKGSGTYTAEYRCSSIEHVSRFTDAAAYSMSANSQMQQHRACQQCLCL